MERDYQHSIHTFTGGRFWPLDPDPKDMNIVDIAHALSNQCRFTGHVREFYSVAQHCVLVSYQVPEEDALWGLLHDATEAYLVDMASPVKMQMPEFRRAEARLEECVAAAFNLPLAVPQSVHHADRVLLVTEKRDLLSDSGSFSVIHTQGAEPLKQAITPWLPSEAKQAFLRRYRQLRGTPMPAAFRACVNGSCSGIDVDAETFAVKTIAERYASGELK